MFNWLIASDILSSPHTLIAGTTGSGKSTCLNTIICQALQEDSRTTKMVFIDLKRVEFAKYRSVPHCIRMVTDPEEVVFTLDAITEEMEYRYRAIPPGTYQSLEPDIYVVIDELAYTLQLKGALARLTDIGRLGRAANIHLICATQDPSRKTLCSQLMQNFTNVLALRCRSAIESRQILGVAGAESLPPRGRGIYQNAFGNKNIDIPFIDPLEVETFLSLLNESNHGDNDHGAWSIGKYRDYGKLEVFDRKAP